MPKKMKVKKEITDLDFSNAVKNQDNINIIKKATLSYRKIIDVDELKSCGLEALWKSLQCHNEKYKQKFTTTLYRFVDWECKRRLRRKNALKNNPSHFIYSDFSNFLIKKNDLSCYINEKISLLDKNFSILLRQRFFDGFSVKEIGAMNNCTPSIIRYKLLKAIEKLKSICLDL